MSVAYPFPLLLSLVSFSLSFSSSAIPVSTTSAPGRTGSMMSDRWSRRRTRLDEDPFHRLLWPEVETDFARAFEMKDQFKEL